MSKTHRIAWAAGFFDGEGYVTIQVRGGKYKGHYPRIGVNHVKIDPLLEMQKLFGGSIRYDDTPKGNRKPRHSWGVSCQKAGSALKQMLPFLHNKEDVSILALLLLDSMRYQGGNTPPDVLDMRQEIKNAVQGINARS